MLKKIAVIYHANCHDGFSAAWAAWKKLGEKARYVPVGPAEPPEERFKNHLLYFVDTSLTAPVIKKLQKDGNHVVIIDHHFSARKDIREADEYYFDLRHSGAILTWQYFHPDKKLPKFLRYIEDYDLWYFKLPKAKEIAASTRFVDKSFKNWEKLVRDFAKQKKFQEYVRKGKIIMDYENDVVKRLSSRPQLVRIAGFKALAVNSSFLKNEIGDFLKKKSPFSIIWYQSKGKVRISFRSTGKVDVSRIARKFGGGGHKKAAGFVWPLNKKLPWKVVKK